MAWIWQTLRKCYLINSILDNKYAGYRRIYDPKNAYPALLTKFEGFSSKRPEAYFCKMLVIKI